MTVTASVTGKGSTRRETATAVESSSSARRSSSSAAPSSMSRSSSAIASVGACSSACQLFPHTRRYQSVHGTYLQSRRAYRSALRVPCRCDEADLYALCGDRDGDRQEARTAAVPGRLEETRRGGATPADGARGQHREGSGSRRARGG